MKVPVQPDKLLLGIVMMIGKVKLPIAHVSATNLADYVTCRVPTNHSTQECNAENPRRP